MCLREPVNLEPAGQLAPATPIWGEDHGGAGSSHAHFSTDLCQISTWNLEQAFPEAASPCSSLLATQPPSPVPILILLCVS